MGGTPPPISYVILENKALKPHLGHISAGIFALNGLTRENLEQEGLNETKQSFYIGRDLLEN